MTTHILAKQQTENAVREALKKSHAYVAHDWLCDPTGFAFIAKNNLRQVGMMGDEVKLTAGLTFQIAAPTSGKIKLFRNGKIVQEIVSDKLEFVVKEPGIYRAEVWLELDSEWRPWIYANTIRLLN